MAFNPGVIDFVIVAAFVIYSITVGFLYRKQAWKGKNEHFLAGRNLSGTKTGFRMAATQFAVDTPVLVRGLIASQDRRDPSVRRYGPVSARGDQAVYDSLAGAQ